MTLAPAPAQGDPSPGKDRRYLAAAESLLTEGGDGRRGWWPRAVVWLLRIQLEQEIADRLSSQGVPLTEADGKPLNMRARLLMLHRMMPADRARDVAVLWTALSEAGHHHSYELAPTQGELTRWLEGVQSLGVGGGVNP